MASFDANTPLNTLKRLLGAESTVVSGSVGEAQFQPPPDLQTELIGSFVLGLILRSLWLLLSSRTISTSEQRFVRAGR